MDVEEEMKKYLSRKTAKAMQEEALSSPYHDSSEDIDYQRLVRMFECTAIDRRRPMVHQKIVLGVCLTVHRVGVTAVWSATVMAAPDQPGLYHLTRPMQAEAKTLGMKALKGAGLGSTAITLGDTCSLRRPLTPDEIRRLDPDWVKEHLNDPRLGEFPKSMWSIPRCVSSRQIGEGEER